MRLVIALVVVVLALFILLRPRRKQSDKRADPAVYAGLRDRALHGSRAVFGLPEAADSNEPFAVVMDTTFDDGTSYTVVSIADGNASIYLSNGGGFIGGVEHQEVREAAKAAVAAARDARPLMRQADSFPLPAPGLVTFYVLTDAGPFTATGVEQELGEGRSPLSPLFHAVQGVVTQYRLIGEK